MTITRQEVQLRSYRIWERAGRPQGRDWEHWFQAEAELAREQAAIAKPVTPASLKVRAPRSRKTRTTKKPSVE